MKFGERKFLLWPLILARSFFNPVGLFLPIRSASGIPAPTMSRWDSRALNLAYRLADFPMYSAIGLTNHPGGSSSI
jgi:hypothetical protein